MSTVQVAEQNFATTIKQQRRFVAGPGGAKSAAASSLQADLSPQKPKGVLGEGPFRWFTICSALQATMPKRFMRVGRGVERLVGSDEPARQVKWIFGVFVLCLSLFFVLGNAGVSVGFAFAAAHAG